MKVEIQKAFEKDISKIRNGGIALNVLALIEDLEASQNISELPNLKKMHAKGNFYRIRVGNYRLGLKIQKDTIVLLRFMDRKDIYKYFP